MTNFDGADGLDDLDEAEMRDELTQRMRTVGALIAYRTAVAICLDPKASAAAKASAVNSLLRAGGFFVNRDPAGGEKGLAEMSADEVKALLRKTEAALEQRMVVINAPRGSLFD
jgi:hypothetical protein